MDNCKELFLDDIVEISVHPVNGCSFPIPFAVQGIQQMSGCTLSAPVLHIGMEEGMTEPVLGSMTAKCSPDFQPNGTVFTFDITATIEGEADAVRNAYINIGNNDHYVCLRKRDGSLLLCYTLPGSFAMKCPVTINGTQSRQISITTQALSEFVVIDHKTQS